MPDPLSFLDQSNQRELLSPNQTTPPPMDPELYNSVQHAPDYQDGGWWDSIRSFAGKTIEVAGKIGSSAYGGGYWNDLLGEYSPESMVMKGLGFAGDVARTSINKAIGGQGPTDITAAMMDKSKAATGMDVLKSLGYLPFADKGETSLLKRLPDMAAEFTMTALTDPTMYVGLGEVNAAGKLSRSIGLEAMALLGKGDLLGAEGQMAKIGKTLADVKGWKSAVGLEPTLAGRLRAGQQNLITVHVPLASLFGYEGHVALPLVDKALAPVIEHIANGYASTSELTKIIAPLRSVSKAAETVKDFFFNPEFAHAGGGMQRIAEAVGNNEARQVIEDVYNMRKRLQDAGLKESEYARPMHMKIVSMGKEGKEMQALSSAADEIINLMPTPKRDAVLKEVNEYSALTKRMLETLKSNGVHIDDLGTAIQRDLAVATHELAIRENEFFDQMSVEQKAAGENIKRAHEALISQTDKNLNKTLESYLDLHNIPDAVKQGLENIDSRFASPIWLRQNIASHPEAQQFLASMGYGGFKNLQTRNGLSILEHRVTPREGTGAIDGNMLFKTRDGKIGQVEYTKVGDKINVDWIGSPRLQATENQAFLENAQYVDTGDVGTRGVMDVNRLLAEEHPDVTEFSGQRIGGAHAQAAEEAGLVDTFPVAKGSRDKILRHQFNTLSDLKGGEQTFGQLWSQEHGALRSTPSSLLSDLRSAHGKMEDIRNGIQDPALIQQAVPTDAVDAMANLIRKNNPAVSVDDARLQAVRQLEGLARNKLSDMQHSMALAEDEYLRLKNLYDNTPNWVPMTVTKDALYSFVKDGGQAAELLRPDVKIALERHLEINGRPADTPTFNKIIQGTGTDVTAHMPVKKSLSIGEAITAFRNGGKDEVLRASERLGEFFEINPIVALEGRANKMASAISKARQTRAVAEFWGRKTAGAGTVDLGRFDPKFNGTYVPKDVFEGLVGSWRVAQFRMPEVFNATKIPYLTRLWKAFNTGAVPVFHMRNKVGNTVRRLQEGAISFTPEAMHNEWMVQKGYFMAHNGATPEELNKLRIKLGNNGEVGFGEFLNQAREYNVPSMGEYAMDITEDMAARSDVLTRVMRGEIPASKRLSQVVGSIMGAKATRGFSLTQAGKYIEDADRLASFAEFMRKGETAGGAAMLVDKTLFNYQHISPAVEIARKTGLFPFAAWSAKNIPAQLEAFLTRPGQFAAMLHARDIIEEGVPGLQREKLGKYIKDKFNVATGQDEQGNWVIHDLNGIIPMADLPDIIGPDAMRTFFARSMGPIPRLIAHRLFNKNTFTLKDVETFDGQMGLYQTPIGQIPVDVDTGYDLATITPRFPGSLTRFDTSPKSAARWEGVGNVINPFPGYSVNPNEMAKSDLEYYKNQMNLAKGEVNRWAKAQNRIMQDAAMKVYLKKRADLQEFLRRSTSRSDAP